jgi:plasmid stabilization system protein ParE
MGNFLVSPEAREDLDQIHACISEDNLAAADRVLGAALATFTALATMPGMGRLRTFKSSELSGLRSFRIAGFRNARPPEHRHTAQPCRFALNQARQHPGGINFLLQSQWHIVLPALACAT